MSDDQRLEKAEFSDEMREAARKCAQVIHEHDFAVMGYEADVVDTYAKAYESGRIGPGMDISQDDAASLIRDEFEQLYGQSLEEARAGCEPGLEIFGASLGSDRESAGVEIGRVRLITRDRGNEGHEL